MKIFLAAAVLALAACATIPRLEATSTESLLTDAGFQMRPADTPQGLADLDSMPPRQFVVRSKDGNVVYTFADPDRCRCIYVGGPKEYSALQRLRVESPCRGIRSARGACLVGSGRPRDFSDRKETTADETRPGLDRPRWAR